jgi:hypothetical protein
MHHRVAGLFLWQRFVNIDKPDPAGMH